MSILENIRFAYSNIKVTPEIKSYSLNKFIALSNLVNTTQSLETRIENVIHQNTNCCKYHLDNYANYLP